MIRTKTITYSCTKTLKSVHIFRWHCTVQKSVFSPALTHFSGVRHDDPHGGHQIHGDHRNHGDLRNHGDQNRGGRIHDGRQTNVRYDAQTRGDRGVHLLERLLGVGVPPAVRVRAVAVRMDRTAGQVVPEGKDWFRTLEEEGVRRDWSCMAVAACRRGAGHSVEDPLPGGTAGWVEAGERSGGSALVLSCPYPLA